MDFLARIVRSVWIRSELSRTVERNLLGLGPGEFLGMCCLGDQSERLKTALTLEPAFIARKEKEIMLRCLHAQLRLIDIFLAPCHESYPQSTEGFVHPDSRFQKGLARGMIKTHRIR